jgi:hypothetical protein
MRRVTCRAKTSALAIEPSSAARHSSASGMELSRKKESAEASS